MCQSDGYMFKQKYAFIGILTNDRHTPFHYFTGFSNSEDLDVESCSLGDVLFLLYMILRQNKAR